MGTCSINYFEKYQKRYFLSHQSMNQPTFTFKAGKQTFKLNSGQKINVNSTILIILEFTYFVNHFWFLPLFL